MSQRPPGCLAPSAFPASRVLTQHTTSPAPEGHGQAIDLHWSPGIPPEADDPAPSPGQERARPRTHLPTGLQGPPWLQNLQCASWVDPQVQNGPNTCTGGGSLPAHPSSHPLSPPYFSAQEDNRSPASWPLLPLEFRSWKVPAMEENLETERGCQQGQWVTPAKNTAPVGPSLHPPGVLPSWPQDGDQGLRLLYLPPPQGWLTASTLTSADTCAPGTNNNNGHDNDDNNNQQPSQGPYPVPGHFI